MKLSPEVAAGSRATEMEIAPCIYYLNNLPPFASASWKVEGVSCKYFTVGNLLKYITMHFARVCTE